MSRKMIMIVLQSLLLIACIPGVLTEARTHQQQPAQTADQSFQEGQRYAKERQYDKAVDAFRLAIKLNPDLAAAYYELGNTYANMGRRTDALEPLKTAVRLDPGNSGAHLSLGRVLASLRHFDEGLAEMNQAKFLNPKNAIIFNELGALLSEGFGKFDEALAAYIEARRLSPNLSYIHHNIGLLFIKLGRFSEAIEPFEEALRLDPNYRNARFFLADAYTKTRNYDKAIDSWTKFLELVPNGPDALTARSWTYLYQGGHGKEAAASARTFLDVHGWQRPSSAYLGIMAHLGYREAAMSEEAKAVLDEATNKLTNTNWPYPVIRYLKGELSIDELLQLAGNNDRKTEAHAYAGLDLLLKDRTDEARTHFEWVKNYGNNHFFEYPLAMEELKRLP
jgi:tetratricopeptide (TPR) repeat protein